MARIGSHTQAAAEGARDAALATVPNAFPVDRAALKALDTNSITAAYLKEPVSGGQFVWRLGDYSDEVASDPYEGIYIKADAIPASTGAWVRENANNGQRFNLRWFQVVNDGSDQYAKVQSAIDLAPSGATIYMPYGFRHDTAFTVDKVLEFRGAGIKQTQIISAPTVSGFIITPDLSLNVTVR